MLYSTVSMDWTVSMRTIKISSTLTNKKTATHKALKPKMRKDNSNFSNKTVRINIRVNSDNQLKFTEDKE